MGSLYLQYPLEFTPMRRFHCNLLCLTILVIVAFATNTLAASASAGTSANAQVSISLVPNGNFESDANDDQWPDGWPRPNNGGSWQAENGNRFLRLVSGQPGQMVVLYQLVNLPTGTRALAISWRWHTADLKVGQEAWHDARIMMNFKDAAGNKLSSSPSAPYVNSNTKGWQERTVRFPVPDGAHSLEFMPSLFQVTSGTLDLDDIAIKPIDVAELESTSKAETTPKVKVQELAPEAPQPARWPTELRVVGNQVRTKDGRAVWLQGLNVVSLEWSVGGEHVLRSAQVAVDEWKSNIIRLPMKDDFWFGKGPGQKDGGAAYRALVDAAVNVVANRGAYILLDLHRFRAPTDEHVAFWKEVATKYKNHPAVLFDLFNEPHDISWQVWRDGGLVADKSRPADEDAFLSAEEKAKAAKGFQTPGMQRMVDAVRETGARNIVVVGGLDWAYDLSGIANGFALKDKGGNGIMYATHIYPWKSDWKNKVLIVANKHPVLVGEVGADTKILDFLPRERQENPYTWAPDMIGFIQKHKLHWTAWTFHPGATPRILTDWEYNPTPFWGSFVKSALLGGQFGMQKMR